MDPDYTSDDGEAQEQAMAIAMGFSSFGSHKPPAKKRKFNAAVDAYIEGQELASLDKGGRNGQGSGGNNIPLGKSRVFGTSTTTHTLERPVADSRGENDQDGDSDGGPAYIDTSLPAPTEQPDAIGSNGSAGQVEEVQARIDALLASLNPVSDPLSSIPTTAVPYVPPSHPQQLQSVSLNKGLSKASTAQQVQRVKDRGPWYVDYYDRSFTENPWERLERELGLKPLCKWPENSVHKAQ